MNLRRFASSAAALACGSAAAAALYWALLNVPESNVLALSFSAALALLLAATAGLTTGAAMSLAQGSTYREAARRSAAALPGFFVGLAIFGVLWWMTGAADTAWRDRRGEVDALMIRYAGTARTEWLHVTVAWLTFLTRWAIGVSVVAALVAAGVSRSGGARAIGRGLRSIRTVPLGAACAAVIVITQGLWRAAFWRPGDLPASRIEVVFVATKLAVLSALAIGVATAVLWVHKGKPT